MLSNYNSFKSKFIFRKIKGDYTVFIIDKNGKPIHEIVPGWSKEVMQFFKVYI